MRQEFPRYNGKATISPPGRRVNSAHSTLKSPAQAQPGTVSKPESNSVLAELQDRPPSTRNFTPVPRNWRALPYTDYVNLMLTRQILSDANLYGRAPPFLADRNPTWFKLAPPRFLDSRDGEPCSLPHVDKDAIWEGRRMNAD